MDMVDESVTHLALTVGLLSGIMLINPPKSMKDMWMMLFLVLFVAAFSWATK
jgi:hypothetical protein